MGDKFWLIWTYMCLTKVSTLTSNWELGFLRVHILQWNFQLPFLARVIPQKTSIIYFLTSFGAFLKHVPIWPLKSVVVQTHFKLCAFFAVFLFVHRVSYSAAFLMFMRVFIVLPFLRVTLVCVWLVCIVRQLIIVTKLIFWFWFLQSSFKVPYCDFFLFDVPYVAVQQTNRTRHCFRALLSLFLSI